ncbi:MAG: putative toxin-antitoxin system toxin component, PIN family [Betaproteobacteria bacterium]|nr:putative toxin-antitoxin system toxin component, PIN family [Betaproteobacteria bacterium]
MTRVRFPQRLVLDTNVVLYLVVFRDPLAAPIAQALDAGAAVSVTTHECLAESRRVLAYPKLKLDAAAQNAAFERYCLQARLAGSPASAAPVPLPRCADCEDQKFIELAWHAGARFLITKDKALLRLSRTAARIGGFEILPPGAFAERAAPRTPPVPAMGR